MAKQSVNIGTNPNDGTGDTLRAAMDKLNDNTNEVYSLLGDGSTLSVTGDVSISSGSATIQANSVETAMIADDQITYNKLGAEFTTTAIISASDVDWSTAAVFTKTLSANTTLTFSNVNTGTVIDLVITGDYTLTLPSSVKVISGTYDGTVSNLIQLQSTNGATEQWAIINQEATV